MALISCSECGKKVSSKAISCPSCGAPIADVSSVEAVEKGKKPGKISTMVYNI